MTAGIPAHLPGRDCPLCPRLASFRAVQREAHFRHSAETEKVKSQLLERKFEQALAKSKDEPLTPPTRDIDL